MASSTKLTECYRQLGLAAGADLKAVEEAYFQIRGQMICSDRREEIEPLKAAYHAIKRSLTNEAVGKASGSNLVISPKTLGQSDGLQSIRSHSAEQPAQHISSITGLTSAIAELGLSAKLSIRGQILHIGVTVQPGHEKAKTTNRLYQMFCGMNLAEYDLGGVEIVRVYGLEKGGKPVWKETFPMPNLQGTKADGDLYSFNNRISNTFIFPGLLLLAAALNSIEAIKLMLFGVVIWMHEFGHATVAWLCGYRAIPLPFGWTSTSLDKSLFVYFGVLTLLGLLFWTGQKEQRRWPTALAAALAIAQFYGTWIASDDTYDLLLSFGGIGGEFYLSTLLIVSFYFPLPEKWRWDFYRYPAVLAAGFVFIGSAWKWHQIESGLQAIPWGTLFGGSGDMGGDMNRLVGHGWSDRAIIDTYNSLGGACIAAIVGVYLYFFLKQRNHLFLYAKWRQYQHK